jgi:hypothetical protein
VTGQLFGVADLYVTMNSAISMHLSLISDVISHGDGIGTHVCFKNHYEFIRFILDFSFSGFGIICSKRSVPLWTVYMWVVNFVYRKGKGKGHPITGHEGPRGEVEV